MKLHKPNFLALCSTFLHIILLFTITLLCLQLATSTALTNETGRLALLKFKESIVDDPYGILSSWNDSIQFCYWYGVTCGRHHRRVTALELQGHKLRGTITPYIGNFTFLRVTDLGNNSFYGKIPKEVGHLFRLQHLNIQNNTLGGEILASLANCTKLRVMTIAWNKLIGTIPKSLALFGVNKLNGMVPSPLYNLSSISALRFEVNQLSGALPANIGLTLPNLKLFTLGDNKFYGPIPGSLCNASKLQKIDIPQNNFMGSIL
ncbi:hypothetical protein ACB092_11G024400 [Castanea dentata]